MKRLLILLTAALMMGTLWGPAGAEEAETILRGYSKAEGYVYLSLGEYPQTAEGGVEPILWRVLTADGEKAYLLSEYILFARSMHTSLKESPVSEFRVRGDGLHPGGNGNAPALRGLREGVPHHPGGHEE